MTLYSLKETKKKTKKKKKKKTKQTNKQETHVSFPILSELQTHIYSVDVIMMLLDLNGWQLAKMKKSIPDMSLP